MPRNWSRDLSKPKNPRSYMPWDERLHEYIIDAGTIGRSQNEITHQFKQSVEPKRLYDYLETLRLEGKINRYRVAAGNGNLKTVWRATTKILKP